MSGVSTRWWWLRHAPVPDPEGRITGRLDVACDTSEHDWFKALARRLPQCPLVIQSGFLRADQTLAALEETGLALPPAVLQPAFAEQDFGHWEGRTWNELAVAKDPDLAAFWRDPAHACPPGGESFAEVVARVSTAVQEASQAYAGRDILAVAHAGPIRAALALALGLEPKRALAFVIQPLSLTRLEILADGDWRIGEVNWLPE